ncbi:MAG: DUF1579 domain-containing protein [Mesorhizobium sp.]|uniref:DUF1579 family protein n=1 Tax=Mesorhizobium sp. TaxID=1871066 RepID=UPI000FE31EAC|nr:DUF1579 family protein [Mesorhizobium sp.]RWJ04860.1 MAG: DUF1579 domain-containing protein [Mesorhizobium sp.]RWJ11988.1 MAG: DUF1579 domain-containing protein [Mesorhizobium sp.]
MEKTPVRKSALVTTELNEEMTRGSADRRAFLLWAGVALVVGQQATRSLAQTASPPPADVPPFVQRGLPGPFHAVIRPLEGTWNVDKRIYIAIGTKDRPAVSEGMTCKRHWFGGGKHLEDITVGSIGGSAYYRMGVLGFSTMDRCYEFATFDALNANAMIYRSVALDAPGPRIVLTGVFTDQGLLGEAYTGKSIPMRTTIEILGPDRHSIDLHFMPPGEREVLIDHSTYARA